MILSRARFSRSLVALLVASSLGLGTLLGPKAALAITQDEVVTLTKLGIQPDEIIKAIEKDKTVFNLTVTDILALKKANVDEKVLKFMLATPSRFGAAPGTDPGTQTGPTTPTEPEETPEQKKAREEQMRLEALKLLEEKKKAEEAQRAAFAKGVLATGRALADQGKFVESIQAFQKFVEQGGFAPDSEEAYLAKFGIANALVKAGLYQAAAKELVEVVLAGPERPFFQTAFQQLRELRRKVNYSPPDLEEMTRFFVDNFSRGFQDEFNYVLGEFYYDYNNWSQALKYLDLVSPQAPDYARAQYLKGLVEIRNQLAKSAVQSFQKAIVATEENRTDPEVKDLAFLALARIAYEVGDADAAIYYYRKVPRGTAKQATSLYESAWVYFVKGDYSRALGTFQTLHSPYFKHQFYPELWILEATIYMNLCHFDSAEEALAEYAKQVTPLAVPLKDFLLKTVRPEDYYDALVATVSGKQSFGLPKELAAPVLANVEFYNLYKTLKQIEHEQKIMATRGVALGAFGSEIAAKLESLHKDRTREIGIKIQRVLKDTEGVLAEYEQKKLEIEIDLNDIRLQEEQEKLRALSGGDTATEPPPTAETGGTVAIVGSDTWEWPFEGEYWKDEIGYHRSFIKDQCVRAEE